MLTVQADLNFSNVLLGYIAGSSVEKAEKDPHTSFVNFFSVGGMIKK